MDSIGELTEKIEKFVNDRDWDQFHSPANLAKSISIESAELLECFQWDETDFDKNAVKEELADVINYCIQMSIALKLDIRTIVLDKLQKTEKKYPIEKCRGVSTKYDKL